jgi:transposase
MMSTTAPKPATMPIPVQLSEPEFTAIILPHLSMPKRDPKCTPGYHRVFNLILWVLYTGMQWKCLPIPPDAQGKPAIHYLAVYKVFARWADDVSLWRAFLASMAYLAAAKHLDIRVLHGDGTNTVAKKGGWQWLLGLQAPEGRENHRHHRQQWLCIGSRPRGPRQ